MAMRAIPATNPENKGGVSSFRGDDEVEEDEANRKTIKIKLACKPLLGVPFGPPSAFAPASCLHQSGFGMAKVSRIRNTPRCNVYHQLNT